MEAIFEPKLGLTSHIVLKTDKHNFSNSSLNFLAWTLFSNRCFFLNILPTDTTYKITVSIVHEFIFLNIIAVTFQLGKNDGVSHSESIFYPVTHSSVAFDHNFCLQMGTDPVHKSFCISKFL
jgi:hypothetical protein